MVIGRSAGELLRIPTSARFLLGDLLPGEIPKRGRVGSSGLPELGADARSARAS